MGTLPSGGMIDMFPAESLSFEQYVNEDPSPAEIADHLNASPAKV
jgi:hypothetical protein